MSIRSTEESQALSDTGTEQKLLSVENELYDAAVRQQDQSAESQPDIEQLMRRARREVGLRDVVSFGFAHLLATMLSLLAKVLGKVPERIEEPDSGSPVPERISD